MSRLGCLLRIGSIRYTAYYFAAYYGAIELTGHGGPGWIAGGFLICALVCLGIELLNRYTDQREDRINNPERTRLCDTIGYRDIGFIALAIFLLLALIGLAWVYLYANLQLFILQGIIWLVAWNYSAGLRFKAWPHATFSVIGFTFILPFLVGWAMYAPLTEVPPAILFVPLFIASIAGLKDLTDIEGDRAQGYDSKYLSLLQAARWKMLPLLLLPYAALTALVLSGAAPARFLLLLAFLPVSAALAAAGRSARSPSVPAEEKRAVRESMYHVWILVLALAILLIDPTPRLALVLTGDLAFWIYATRRLHWLKGLEPNQLRATAALIFGGDHSGTRP